MTDSQYTAAKKEVEKTRQRIRSGDTSKAAREAYHRALNNLEAAKKNLSKKGLYGYKDSDGSYKVISTQKAQQIIDDKRKKLKAKNDAMNAERRLREENNKKSKYNNNSYTLPTVKPNTNKSTSSSTESDKKKARREKEEQEEKEYKEKRAASQVEQAKQRKLNHEKTMKQRAENEKQAVLDATGSYERAKAALDEFTKQDIEDAKDMSKHKTFSGTSAQAKEKLASDMKNILNITTGEATATVKAAYDASKKYASSQGGAGEIVNGIITGKIFKNPKPMLLGYTEEQLANMTSQSLLDLEKLNCSDRLAETIIIDNIADSIMKQKEAFTSSFGSYKEAFILERTYITAYFKQTFGNPEFIKGVRAKVYVGVSDYIDALSQEQLDKFTAKADQKIDKIFNKVDGKIDRVTSKIDKITTKLDNLTKIDILSSISNKIDSTFSLNSLQNKLNKTFLGSLIAPTVGAIGQSIGNIVKLNFTSMKFMKSITAIQDKIKVVQQQIQKAKEFIANKVQMVKNYVNNLKQKAIDAVKTYASKIISDITSKIKLSIGGALGF